MTIWDDWFETSFANAGMVIASVVAIYLSVILLTRIAGPRSFSKLSAFDFAMTVAIGTLIGSAASSDPPISQVALAIATLYALQVGVAFMRRKIDHFKETIDNRPILLMAGDHILHDNLSKVRVTESDLWTVLRQAGVSHPVDVMAVIMETTGDMSVLKSNGPGSKLDERLLNGVRDSDRLLTQIR